MPSPFQWHSQTEMYAWPWLSHDDVIKWKHFPRYWHFVRGIHRSPVNSPHKGQWRGALMFSLIYAWINGWVNSREAGDLRRHRAHYDAIVIRQKSLMNALNLMPIWYALWANIRHMENIWKPNLVCTLETFIIWFVQCVRIVFLVPFRDHFGYGLSQWPVRDDVILYRRLSLAKPIPRMTSACIVCSFFQYYARLNFCVLMINVICAFYFMLSFCNTSILVIAMKNLELYN